MLGVAIVLAVVGYLAVSGIGTALVYYRTPTELAAMEDALGRAIRLGGLVKPGSVVTEGSSLTFVLTDGTTEITVMAETLPPSSFREGVGAVVEGELAGDGTFQATQVIVKHDENYVAPSPGALPSSQVIDPGS
jgi:cytochrome c-type biogenesis protein CcmE